MSERTSEFFIEEILDKTIDLGNPISAKTEESLSDSPSSEEFVLRSEMIRKGTEETGVTSGSFFPKTETNKLSSDSSLENETEERKKERLALENYFQTEKFFYPKLFSEDKDSARANLVLYPNPEILIKKRRRENEKDSKLNERLVLDLVGLAEQYTELYNLINKELPNLVNWLPSFAVRSEWPNNHSKEFVKKVDEVLRVKTWQIFSRLAFLSDCAYQINEAINSLEKIVRPVEMRMEEHFFQDKTQ